MFRNLKFFVKHPLTVPARSSFTSTKASSSRHNCRRKLSTKVNTQQSNSFKKLIIKELMATIPDDLSMYKSFELKFETKSVYIKSERF